MAPALIGFAQAATTAEAITQAQDTVGAQEREQRAHADRMFFAMPLFVAGALSPEVDWYFLIIATRDAWVSGSAAATIPGPVWMASPWKSVIAHLAAWRDRVVGDARGELR